MAKLELEALDKFIVGESWIGSQIDRYRDVLCDEIGARWGGSEKDKETAEFIVSEMLLNGLNNPRVEPFQIKTWQHESSVVKVIETGRKIKSLPFLRCPAAKVEVPLIDVGHASNEELSKSALKSNSSQKTINLKKIHDNSDDGTAVVIAGKVLGTGTIAHKIILSSFSISNSAAKKIKESGGEVIKFSEMIERFPTGKGVKIIG